MTRSAAALPTSTWSFAGTLADRARREIDEIKYGLQRAAVAQRNLTLDAALEARIHSGKKDDLRSRARNALKWDSTPQERSESDDRLAERLAALEATYVQESAERARTLREAVAEEDTLKRRLKEARTRERTVREAKDSYDGLAPWDAVALEALRAWGDLPQAPEETPTQLLKGADIVTLFQERLGVSRATYYGRYRHLLRSYYVTPLRVKWFADGGAVVHRGATQRFRRDEVEALFVFLVTHAV